MISFKIIQLTFLLWFCGLCGKTTVECHQENIAPVIRHKRLISEELSDRDLVKGLISEALELENNFSQLKKTSNMTALYKTLSDRVEGVRLHEGNDDDERALSHLKLILKYKLIDLKEEHGLIIDLEFYAGHTASKIELRNRIIPEITSIDDEDLKNNLNNLRFRVNGNYIVNEYQNYIDGFQLTYFPFAACYLESLRLPTSPSIYENLDAMTTAFTTSLNESKRHIDQIKSNGRDVAYVEGSRQEDAFYVWKSSEVSDQIPKLFKGEKITLLADVKKATEPLNALRFNKINLVFRSSNQTVTRQLKNALKAFELHASHSGQSAFRYNDHFYQLTSQPLRMFFNFEKTRQKIPVAYSSSYMKLRDNRPVLSPYTEWEFRLFAALGRTERFLRLTPFQQLDIDVELHGSGTYVSSHDSSICEEENLSRFYTEMEGY